MAWPIAIGGRELWSPTWEIICADDASLCKMRKMDERRKSNTRSESLEQFVAGRRPAASCYRSLSHVLVGGQNRFQSITNKSGWP